ncbi:MAG: hypothetical protein IJ317_01990, partial [Clostridia bacterium]|nr:hypothetical protein [Clostridia bacterium]
CFMGCGDAHLLYNAGSGSSTTSGVSWTQYSYDAEGNPQKTTTGNVTKQWVTYEIKFSATSVEKVNSQIYFFKLPNTMWDLDYGIYVKDFTYSTTQLTAFANAQ